MSRKNLKKVLVFVLVFSTILSNVDIPIGISADEVDVGSGSAEVQTEITDDTQQKYEEMAEQTSEISTELEQKLSENVVNDSMDMSSESSVSEDVEEVAKEDQETTTDIQVEGAVEDIGSGTSAVEDIAEDTETIDSSSLGSDVEVGSGTEIITEESITEVVKEEVTEETVEEVKGDLAVKISAGGTLRLTYSDGSEEVINCVKGVTTSTKSDKADKSVELDKEGYYHIETLSEKLIDIDILASDGFHIEEYSKQIDAGGVQKLLEFTGENYINNVKDNVEFKESGKLTVKFKKVEEELLKVINMQIINIGGEDGIGGTTWGDNKRSAYFSTKVDKDWSLEKDDGTNLKRYAKEQIDLFKKDKKKKDGSQSYKALKRAYDSLVKEKGDGKKTATHYWEPGSVKLNGKLTSNGNIDTENIKKLSGEGGHSWGDWHLKNITCCSEGKWNNFDSMNVYMSVLATVKRKNDKLSYSLKYTLYALPPNTKDATEYQCWRGTLTIKGSQDVEKVEICVLKSTVADERPLVSGYLSLKGAVFQVYNKDKTISYYSRTDEDGYTTTWYSDYDDKTDILSGITEEDGLFVDAGTKLFAKEIKAPPGFELYAGEIEFTASDNDGSGLFMVGVDNTPKTEERGGLKEVPKSASLSLDITKVIKEEGKTVGECSETVKGVEYTVKLYDWADADRKLFSFGEADGLTPYPSFTITTGDTGEASVTKEDFVSKFGLVERNGVAGFIPGNIVSFQETNAPTKNGEPLGMDGNIYYKECYLGKDNELHWTELRILAWSGGNLIASGNRAADVATNQIQIMDANDSTSFGIVCKQADNEAKKIPADLKFRVIKKSDKETEDKETKPLAGVKYNVTLYVKNETGTIIASEYADGTEGANALVTNSDGIIEVDLISVLNLGDKYKKGKYQVPIGSTVVIQETEGLDGYIKDENRYIATVELSSDGEKLVLSDFSPVDTDKPSKISKNEGLSTLAYETIDHTNLPIMGDAAIQKKDETTDSTKPRKGTNFGGITYDLFANEDIIFNGIKKFSKGDKVTTVECNAETGLAKTADESLYPGKYYFKESTGNKWYKCNSEIKTEFTLPDNEQGYHVTTIMQQGNEQVRGDFKFTKYRAWESRALKTMSNIPFLVTVKDGSSSPESHIIITDKNGNFDSSSLLGEKEYNKLDNLIKMGKGLSKDSLIKASDLEGGAGRLWFGEKAKEYPNNKGSLYTDTDTGVTYLIQELWCEGNSNVKEMYAAEFTVKDGEVVVVKEKDFDGIRNIPTPPLIKSTALGKDSGDHIVDSSALSTIVDTVEYSNLAVGHKYSVKSWLVDTATAKTAVINGTEVPLATDEFIATDSKMVRTNSFTFNSINADKGKYVVYVQLADLTDGEEYGYDAWAEENISQQEVDIFNEDQTVYLPVIETDAYDTVTKEQTVTPTKQTETADPDIKDLEIGLTDKVTMKNFLKGKTYKIIGTVYNSDNIKVAGPVEKEVVIPNDAIPGKVVDEYTAELSFKFIDEVDMQEGMQYYVSEIVKLDDAVVADHDGLGDSRQTVYMPGIDSRYYNVDTKSRTAYVSEPGKTTILTDQVYLRNMKAGSTYKVVQHVRYADTGEVVVIDGKELTQERTILAESDGELEITFEYEVDTSNLAGKTVTFCEYMEYNGVKLNSHENVNDTDEQPVFPEVTTKAKDNSTLIDLGKIEGTTITDTVSVKNLQGNPSIKIIGTLMDKATGEYLGKDLGWSPITAEESVASAPNSFDKELVFDIPDSSKLAGKSLVVYQEIKSGDDVLAYHKDINDANQTIRFAEEHTKAYWENGKKMVRAEDKDFKLVDRVYYTNLVPGKKYKQKASVYVKETGAPFTVDGNAVEKEVEFTPTEPNGYINVEFTINTKDLEGKTFVIFEDLYREDIHVATHADLEDLDQTVYVPKIRTNAWDKESLGSQLKLGKTVELVDTISYWNLDAGKYWARAEIIDKATDEVLKKVVKEFNVGNTSRDGKVDVEFTIDTEKLQGKTLVIYEEVYDGEVDEEGVPIPGSTKSTVAQIPTEIAGEEAIALDGTGLVASHKDKEDATQTVYVSEIKTRAWSPDTNTKQLLLSEQAKLIDTIDYKNMLPGNYYAKAELVDLSDHSVINTVQKNFTVVNSNDSVDVEFTLDAKPLRGKTFVVYEHVYTLAGMLVGMHKNDEDKNQIVSTPEIKTRAWDKISGDKIVTYGTNTGIVDTITYKNLLAGNYTAKARLVDKDTGTVLSQGESKFVATTPDGTVDVDLVVDAKANKGKTVVVYEEVYDEGEKLIADHINLGDVDQTLYIPDIHTTAKGLKNKKKLLILGEDVVVSDVIDYSTFIPGEYVAKAKIVDKSNPSDVIGEAEQRFTVSEANGSVAVDITIDTTELVGKTLVVFEDVYDIKGNLIAEHEDADDVEQTVYVAEIGTKASDGETGKKKMILGKDVTLIDTVSYTNLVEGETYTLKGTVMDKVSKKKVTKEKIEFTADAVDGSEDMEFNLNTEKLQGKDLVVFEELYDSKGNLVAEHKDYEDKGQTVSVPESPIKPNKSHIPRTADRVIWLLIVGAVLILMGIGVLTVRRKKSN